MITAAIAPSNRQTDNAAIHSMHFRYSDHTKSAMLKRAWHGDAMAYWDGKATTTVLDTFGKFSHLELEVAPLPRHPHQQGPTPLPPQEYLLRIYR